MRISPHRLLAALVLLCWTAPGASVLGLGLHHALAHHGHHQAADDHGHDLAELAHAALHGHHHEAEATPDHEHPAMVEKNAPVLKSPSMTLASLASGAFLAPRPPVPTPDARPAPPGSPAPLFTAHCSLLL